MLVIFYTLQSVIVGARCILLCSNSHEIRYSLDSSAQSPSLTMQEASGQLRQENTAYDCGVHIFTLSGGLCSPSIKILGVGSDFDPCGSTTYRP